MLLRGIPVVQTMAHMVLTSIIDSYGNRRIHMATEVLDSPTRRLNSRL